jgi:putative oxidoreductase
MRQTPKETKEVNLVISIFRVLIGVLLIIYGIDKVMHSIFIRDVLKDAGLPTFSAYICIAVGFIAPIFIIIGYKTRLAAIAILCNCLYLMSVIRINDLLELYEQGRWAMTILVVFLICTTLLIISGGGKYAIGRHPYLD